MQSYGFLWVPLLAAVVLTGIHAYLGLQVVRRGVVFSALALPQLAALGTAVAYLAGHDPHAAASYLWSLASASLGAAILLLARRRSEIIAALYAISGGATVAVMSGTPEGTEHLQDLLFGDILTVSKHTLLATALIYAAVAFLLWLLRRNVSDFLVYLSMSAVVTSSVAIGGVLLAFSFLLLPAVAATMLVTRNRLAVAWTFGALGSAAGLLISLLADLPAGATIVCTFGIALLLLTVVRFRRWHAPSSAISQCQSASANGGAFPGRRSG